MDYEKKNNTESEKYSREKTVYAPGRHLQHGDYHTSRVTTFPG